MDDYLKRTATRRNVAFWIAMGLPFLAALFIELGVWMGWLSGSRLVDLASNFAFHDATRRNAGYLDEIGGESLKLAYLYISAFLKSYFVVGSIAALSLGRAAGFSISRAALGLIFWMSCFFSLGVLALVFIFTDIFDGPDHDGYLPPDYFGLLLLSASCGVQPVMLLALGGRVRD